MRTETPNGAYPATLRELPHNLGDISHQLRHGYVIEVSPKVRLCDLAALSHQHVLSLRTLTMSNVGVASPRLIKCPGHFHADMS